MWDCAARTPSGVIKTTETIYFVESCGLSFKKPVPSTLLIYPLSVPEIYKFINFCKVISSLISISSLEFL